ncbi:hypothetical protein [Endozoicomonas lisbonensis]|uniref:DUF5610 domain-containing protein n=1 Tax=Endozoicomonas lisbonensis TaxID=3120522 RepID=A0ABV2SPA4_9GAMM
MPELPAYLQELVDAVSKVIKAFESNISDLATAVAGKLGKDEKAVDSAKLGGKLPSAYSDADHTHDEFIHNHDERYSKLDHSHSAGDVGAYSKTEADNRFLGITAQAESAKKADRATAADDADTVNGKTVGKSVPANAVFTDTQRDITDSVTTNSSEVSASATAVRTVNSKAEDALDKIDELNASIVGQFKHLGGVDLSSGEYPDKPEYSAIWHVQEGGTVGEETHVANASTKSSETYEKGDSLVYSLDLDMFYKVEDKASISSDEVYQKFLQKDEQAADSAKLQGKSASAFATAGHDHDDDYAAKSHNHSIGHVTGLQDKLDSKSDDDHDHDADYLGITAKAVDSAKLNGQAASFYATATGLSGVKTTAEAAKSLAESNEAEISEMRPELDTATEITGDLVLLCAHLTELLNDSVTA